MPPERLFPDETVWCPPSGRFLPDETVWRAPPERFFPDVAVWIGALHDPHPVWPGNPHPHPERCSRAGSRVETQGRSHKPAQGGFWEDRASFLGPRASGPSLPMTYPALPVVGCRETEQRRWRRAFRKRPGGMAEIAHKKNAPEARGPRPLGKPPRVAQVGLCRLWHQGAGRPFGERPWGSTRRSHAPRSVQVSFDEG